MRLIGLALVVLAMAISAFGQVHGPQYGGVGGFGSVLYPGTGHPPPHLPGGLSSPGLFPSQLANTIQGVPFAPRRAFHPAHGRSVIVPYPVFVGGYNGYGYDQPQPQPYPGYQDQPPVVTNAAPSVVINQNFIPERSTPAVRDYNEPPQQSSMKMYQAPPSHPYADAQEQTPAPAASKKSDEATIYLLAFKDHNIVPALGYWMEGGTLHYVSVEHSLNQVSLDLVDRDLSQRLNDERGVEFKLPKQ